MWKAVAGAGLGLIALTSSGVALAGSADLYKIGNFTVDAGVGVMQGTANEYVYNTNGTKLSQLVWKYGYDPVLSGGVAWSPMPWLAIGGRGKINLADKAKLDDYDWGVAGCPALYCHSEHDNTKVSRYTSVDLYGAVDLPSPEGLRLRGIAGYKWDQTQFKGYDGVANYGTLPSGLGITYDQWWETPYLGVEAQATIGRLMVAGRVIGSAWATSHDKDQHHWRELVFTESFSDSKMIGATASVGYAVTETMHVKAEYEYQAWQLAKGPTTVKDTYTGAVATFPGNAAGADNTTHMVSLGVNEKF